MSETGKMKIASRTVSVAKRGLAGPACGFLLLLWLSAPAVFGAEIPERVVGEMKAMIEEGMAAQGIPGVATTWFDRDEILWSEEFGWTDRSHETRIGPETRFSAQSTSKLICALALLHAQEKGLVDLDAPLARYLPGIAIHSVWQKNPQQAITLRQLLNHTSGLPHEARVNNNYSLVSGPFDEHLASIAESWLKFPVGSRQSYSNLGYSLAGRVLEVVTGMQFEEYVERNVLVPAGITRGTLRRENALADSDRALGHSVKFSKVPECPDIPPAGGFYSTTSDLARLSQLVMREGRTSKGRQWLRPESVAQLFEMPFASEGQRFGHGLGLEKKIEGSVEYILAPGRGFGFIGGVVWVPEANLGMAMLINNQDAVLPYQMLFAFMSYVGEQLPKTVAAARGEGRAGVSEPPVADLERVIGEYIGEEARITVTGNEGAYLIDAGDGGGLRPARPIPGGLVFEAPGRSVRLRFTEDLGTGRPALVDLAAGVAYLANRVPAKKASTSSDWKRHEGTYRLRQWGEIVATHRFEVRDGIAFWDDLTLDERRTGLFFSPTGEALDLRGATPYFSGIELQFEASAPESSSKGRHL